jgi:hypothetical protein
LGAVPFNPPLATHEPAAQLVVWPYIRGRETNGDNSSSDRERVRAGSGAPTEINFAVADVPETIAVQHRDRIEHRPVRKSGAIREPVVVGIDVQIDRRRGCAPNEKEGRRTILQIGLPTFAAVARRVGGKPEPAAVRINQREAIRVEREDVRILKQREEAVSTDRAAR